MNTRRINMMEILNFAKPENHIKLISPLSSEVAILRSIELNFLDGTAAYPVPFEIVLERDGTEYKRLECKVIQKEHEGRFLPIYKYLYRLGEIRIFCGKVLCKHVELKLPSFRVHREDCIIIRPLNWEKPVVPTVVRFTLGFDDTDLILKDEENPFVFANANVKQL